MKTMIKSCLIGLCLAFFSMSGSAAEPSGASNPSASAESLEAALDLTTEGNIYRCTLDFNIFGELVEICVLVVKDPKSPQSAPAPAGELQAAEAVAQLRLPIKVSRNLLEQGATAEVCEVRIDSGCCKVLTVLPNGTVIIECDSQAQAAPGEVVALGDPICVPDRPCCLPSDGANCPKRRLP